MEKSNRDTKTYKSKCWKKNTAIFNLNDVYQDVYYGSLICQMIKYIPRTKNN